MQKTGELIRELREKQGYPLRKVAAFLDIDQAVLSKIERGQRKFTKQHILKLADFLNYDKKELMIAFLSDRIIYSIENEEYGKEALKVAEEIIEYQAFKLIDRKEILSKIKTRLKHFSKVQTAWIYGSFSREDDRPESDIDIAIKTDEGFSYFDLGDVQYQLEKEINRKIDIGFISSFKPYIFENLKPDLKLIYER
jgi:predicted nucleotidyltransferase/plasmid maintenance system antidote protein VapI